MKTTFMGGMVAALCASSALIAPAAAQDGPAAEIGSRYASAAFWTGLEVSLAGVGVTDNGLRFGLNVTISELDAPADQATPAVVSNADETFVFRATVGLDGCLHEIAVDTARPAPVAGRAAAAGLASGVGPDGVDWYASVVSRDAGPGQTCDGAALAAASRALGSTITLDNGIVIATRVTLDNGIVIASGATPDSASAPIGTNAGDDVDLLPEGFFAPDGPEGAPRPASIEPSVDPRRFAYFTPRFAGFMLGVNYLDAIEATRASDEQLDAEMRYAGEFGGFFGYQRLLDRSGSDSGPFLRASLVAQRSNSAVDGLRSSQIGPLSEVTGDATLTSFSGLFGGGYSFGPSLVGGKGFSLYVGVGPSLATLSLDKIASTQSGPFLDDSDQALGVAFELGVDVPITENIGAGVRIDRRLYSFEVTTQQGVRNDLDIAATSVNGFVRFGF